MYMWQTLPNQQGLVPYKKLTWSDFPVNNSATYLDAQTQGKITYSYKTRWERNNNVYTVYLTELTFAVWFDTQQSWRRRNLPRDADWLLQHEQGHLDISYIAGLSLMQLKPEAIMPETGASQEEAEEQLKAHLKRLLDATLEKTKRRHAQYDAETNHSRNKDMQAKWNAQIARELKNAKTAVS
jgi:hypothetical protein